MPCVGHSRVRAEPVLSPSCAEQAQLPQSRAPVNAQGWSENIFLALPGFGRAKAALSVAGELPT